MSDDNLNKDYGCMSREKGLDERDIVEAETTNTTVKELPESRRKIESSFIKTQRREIIKYSVQEERVVTGVKCNRS